MKQRREDRRLKLQQQMLAEEEKGIEFMSKLKKIKKKNKESKKRTMINTHKIDWVK